MWLRDVRSTMRTVSMRAAGGSGSRPGASSRAGESCTGDGMSLRQVVDVPPYATRLRESLAKSRRRGLCFEDAWRAAIREYGKGPGDIAPWPMEFTEQVMRKGYHRTITGTAGLLAELGDVDVG